MLDGLQPSCSISCHPQNFSTPDVAGGEVAKRHVCLFEWDGRRGDLDSESLRQDQELLTVPPCVARDTADGAFVEQMALVVQSRDVAHVDPGQGQRSARAQGLQ